MPIKTSKADFNAFKKAFREYMELFGLKSYRVCFYHRELGNCYADICVDEDGKTADVTFTQSFENYEKEGYEGPEAEAKHEAIHLLLYHLEHLAMCRYIRSWDIKDEVEGIVRILEKSIA